MEFTGKFETHITVSLKDLDRVEALEQWGINHGLKLLHIVLDRGVTVSQLMLTRHGRGSLTNELKTAFDSSQSLNAEGFTVTRIKIEVPQWNQSVPQSNAEALNHPGDRYFEHHIKLLLEPSADIRPLIDLAERHSAYLSRNLFQTRSDQYYERFVTQRCISVGRVEAQQKLQTLLKAIASLRYLAIDLEAEFVVYDSNLDLDSGWIKGKESAISQG
ncbi:hypothetical protein QUA56_09875 [Microcoleus sp. N3A4]|uniref:hypothetical protein n=1 Tax=Microcoleus sp. N3A4 TaxID=3055379 RepID=UPI002FCF9744